VARTCPFCERPADTVEHVDPRWISRHYLDSDTSPGTFTMSFGELYTSRTVPVLNQTVKVCGTCNSGWMARLEDQVRLPLLKMKSGEGLIIGPDGQRLLTKWLLKNALVRELVTPGDSPFRVSTPEQRGQVARDEIPAGWRVAIGGYEGPGPHLHHKFSRVKQLVDDRGSQQGRVILHTLRFECFVAQVLIHSQADSPELLHLLGGPQFAIEIPQELPVAWPLPAVLGPEWMEIVEDFGPHHPRSEG
jgi:hypothetical protein